MAHPSYPVRLTQVDGRPVSFRVQGSGARRVLFFHGFPGSSRQISLLDSRLGPDDLTVVSLDRPGYGQSAASERSTTSERRGAGLGAWLSSGVSSANEQIAEGIRQCRGVLSELGWDRFEVLAVSGGTPLGLSLAHAMPEQVIRTHIACGLGPVGDPRTRGFMPRKSRAGLSVLPRIPRAWLARLLRSSGGPDAFAKDLSVIRYFFDASAPDQEVLRREDVQAALLEAKLEAFAQGGLGPQADARSYLSPWGWDFAEFKGRVRFFHGDQDRVIPPAMARFMTAVIPGAELHMMEGEGHFSLPIRRLARILGE